MSHYHARYKSEEISPSLSHPSQRGKGGWGPCYVGQYISNAQKYQFALFETDLLDAKTHYSICSTFLHCVSSNVSSNCVHKWKHSHIGCICLAFLHCVFSNVTSMHLDQNMYSYIGCICLTFLHCAFSDASSNGLPERTHNHIGCICLAFLHCVFSNVFSSCLHLKMHSHTGCIC